MASCSKKPRIENELDVASLPKHLIRELATALDGLCFETSRLTVTLRPLKILDSNAADGRFGIPFSKAYCYLDDTNKLFMFGDIFRRGLDILTEYLDQGKLPDVKLEQLVLSRLLRFLTTVLLSADEQHPFQNLERLNETELTTVFANHLFGKLSTSSNYTIDKNCIGKKKDRCLCGRPDCRLIGSFGDTSIGNGEVWHGNLDIIINDDLGIEPLDKKPISPGGKSPIEVKLKSDSLSKNAQIIAETIVFSFLQKQRHPEREHFLTPCIGVGSSELIVMLYDSEYDILLESSRIALFDSSLDEDTPKQLSLTALLISWLVVNYKHLSSGLTEDMQCALKAEFFQQAKEKMEVYESRLKYQNVGISTSSNEKKREKDIIFPSTFTFEKHQKLSKVIFLAKDIKDETT